MPKTSIISVHGPRRAALKDSATATPAVCHGQIVRWFPRVCRFALVAVAMAVSAPRIFAQFGGNDGDVVIFMLSSKGNGSLKIASPTTPNSAAALSAFQIIDPKTVPFDPTLPGIFFPNYKLQVLHSESDDKMQILTNLEGIPTLHHQYLTTFKLFTFVGTRREYGDPGEPVMDVPANVYASFFNGQDIGPNEALEREQALVWTSKPVSIPFVPTPRGYHGSLNGPDVTGTQMLLDSATFPVEVPWVPTFRKYPAQGWKDGFDIKFIENDPTMGSTAQMLRIHVGTTTPTFTISGATHFLVLQGNAKIKLAGGPTSALPNLNYAFIPNGLTFSLSNPRIYDGPTGQ